MRTLPNVVAIDFSFAGIPAHLYLLHAGRECALIDTGLAETPQQEIFPLMGRLGLTPSSLLWVVNTHAHSDHIGGNASVKRAAGSTVLASHRADAPWIRDPGKQFREFIAPWADIAGMTLDDFLAAVGPGTPVDRELEGGELLSIGDRQLEVLHTPGHSQGHVSLWDAESGLLFSGDAVQGAGIPIDGGQTICPMFTSLPAYEETIRRITRLEPETILTAHHGRQHGQEARRFLKSSMLAVERIREAVRDAVVRRPGSGVRRLAPDVADELGYALNIQMYVSLEAVLNEVVAP